MISILKTSDFQQPKPDVPHRARIGFVLPAEDKTIESDIRSIELNGVEWSFSRMAATRKMLHPLDRNREQALKQIHQATASLQTNDDLDVAFFAGGCLATVISNDCVLDTIRAGSKDAIVSSVYTATKRAARAVQAKNIVVATGYDSIINQLINDAYTSLGINVVSISGMPKTFGFDFSNKSPQEIRDFALSLDRADADAIVINSTTMRAMEVIDELEQTAGKPVICSNQIAIWDTLRSVGVSDRISGYGSLLQDF